LKTAVPLLVLADEIDALGFLEASSDKVLPLVAKAVELAPALLPIAGVALKLPGATLYAGAGLSLAAAAAVIISIPDDSVTDIAIQTALAVPLGAILPVSLGLGGFLLSKLK
jgi:hypothetical protein